MVLKKASVKKLIRNFAIELLIYAVLVVGYFLLVLRYLGDPLKELFDGNLVLYAFAALGLIVAQGVALEAITTFLLNQLGLERLE
jgi:hypothetical protein